MKETHNNWLLNELCVLCEGDDYGRKYVNAFEYTSC